MIQFEYSYKPLVSEDIRNFENKYGVILPVDYKIFLLHNNGGKPVKRRFKTADGTITTSIMLFLPISEETESNLQSFYNQYNLGEIVPSNLLPIGIDPADSLIA
ncbi:SMI1/KNR4 family protein [Bacillus sp. DX4.1]|nr:SMI1/KNR4 family protein [Bacillus sp. DX4.1]MDM5186299.1 SMI1/KNR4 family protein [Bacillus sp. DX4.1]